MGFLQAWNKMGLNIIKSYASGQNIITWRDQEETGFILWITVINAMWVDRGVFLTNSYGLPLETDSMGQRPLLMVCWWLISWGLEGGFWEAKKINLQVLESFWVQSCSRTSQQNSTEKPSVCWRRNVLPPFRHWTVPRVPPPMGCCCPGHTSHLTSCETHDTYLSGKFLCSNTGRCCCLWRGLELDAL